MYNKLRGVEERFRKLEQLLSDPEVVKDQKAYQKYVKEHGELSRVVAVFKDYQQVLEDIEGSLELLKDDDPEMKEMARDDLASLEGQKLQLEEDLKILMIPKDPMDSKNVIVEIRAGTGGDEAGLFASDLFRMYSRYAENRNWKIEIMDSSSTGVGGLKEVIVMVSGAGAYSRFKFESGTHRVQRVPATETQGRIHTSAVTVAILPEAEEVEVDLNPADIKIDVFRASGPGGQSVNTTDSAVRITHVPTGIVATCQDEKSQHKNREKAMQVLRARIYDKIAQEQHSKRADERKGQVGTGDRSGRIRTYNYPQGRVTDHRIGLTLYKLDAVMQGDIDGIIDPLNTHYQAEALQNVDSGAL